MAKHNRHKYYTALLPMDVVPCVVSPDNRLVADIYTSLPAEKPLWLGAYPDVLHRAVSHDFASFWYGKPVISGDAFIRQVAQAYENAVYQHLALMQKTGSLILGLEAIWKALESDRLCAVIIATDAGNVEARRLQKKLAGGIPAFLFGSRQRLGETLGRHSQVFIGVRSGNISEKLIAFLRCSTRFHLHPGI